MSVLRLRSARGVAWSPYLLTPSVLRAWWHADDHDIAALMTDDGAGLISSWKDRINLVNPTAATTARPTWSETGFGGSRSAVVFNGSSNAMTTTAITALPTGSSAGHVFALASATTTSGHIVGYGAGSGTGRRLVAGGAVGSENEGRFFVDNGSATFSLGPVGSATSARIFEGWWSGTTMGGSVDGVDLAPATIPTLNTATTRLRLASNIGSSAGNFLPGSIRQVIITTALTEAQRHLVRAYLAEDAGVALS